MKKLVSSILLVGLLAGTVSAGASFAMDPDSKKPGQNMAMQESEDSRRNREALTECLSFVGIYLNPYISPTDGRVLNDKRKLEATMKMELAKDNIEKATVDRCIEEACVIMAGAYFLRVMDNVKRMDPKKVLEDIIEDINFYKEHSKNIEFKDLREMNAIKMFAEAKLENPDTAQINIRDLIEKQTYYHIKYSVLEIFKTL